MAEAFLDSSTLIEISFRHEAVATKAHAAIPEQAKRITSRYVLFEIARGYFLSLLVLHNKAHQVKSMVELHQYTHEGQQIFKPYKRGTMLGAYDDFLAHLQNLKIPMTEDQRLAHLRAWLSFHLRRGWRALCNAATIINSIGCREIPAPTRKANALYEQPLPKSECGLLSNCGLASYLTNHQSDFEATRDHLRSLLNHDAETTRRIEAIYRLLQRPDGDDFRGKDCWDCGDALICHEAPESAVVVSKNQKHFGPICAALGREFSGYS